MHLLAQSAKSKKLILKIHKLICYRFYCHLFPTISPRRTRAQHAAGLQRHVEGFPPQHANLQASSSANRVVPVISRAKPTTSTGEQREEELVDAYNDESPQRRPVRAPQPQRQGKPTAAKRGGAVRRGRGRPKGAGNAIAPPQVDWWSGPKITTKKVLPQKGALRGPLTPNTNQKYLKKRFDVLGTSSTMIAAALNEHGYKISNINNQDLVQHGLLVRYISDVFEGRNPYYEEMCRSWESDKAAFVEDRNLTEIPAGGVPVGLKDTIIRECEDDWSGEELAAFLWKQIINNQYIECARGLSCAKLASQDGQHEAPQAPEGGMEEIPHEDLGIDIFADDNEPPILHPGAYENESSSDETMELDEEENNDHENDEYHHDDYVDAAEIRVEPRQKAALTALCNDPALYKQRFYHYSSIFFFDAMNPVHDFEDHWSDPHTVPIAKPVSRLIRHILPRDAVREFRGALTLGVGAQQQLSLSAKFNEAMHACYVPKGAVCLDEMGVPHKGAGPWVFNSQKPNKRALKIFGVVDTNYVLTWMRPDIIKGAKLKTMEVVKQAVEHLEMHNLPDTPFVADSWYGNLPVARYLQSKKRRFVVALKNTRGNFLVGFLGKKLPEGSAIVMQSKQPSPDGSVNRVSVTAFRQRRTRNKSNKRRPIIVASNICKPEFQDVNGRHKPSVVQFYAKNLGFVDSVDQVFLSMWVRRAYRSWKLKMIHFQLIVAAQNAWRWFLIVRPEAKITFEDFCNLLGMGLLDQDHQTLVAARIQEANSIQPLTCTLQAVYNRPVCVVCKGRASHICTCSNEPVHLRCRDKHHENRALEGAQNIAGRRFRISDLGGVRRFLRYLFPSALFLGLVLAVLARQM